jgi:hypothetical protein
MHSLHFLGCILAVQSYVSLNFNCSGNEEHLRVPDFFAFRIQAGELGGIII